MFIELLYIILKLLGITCVYLHTCYCLFCFYFLCRSILDICVVHHSILIWQICFLSFFFHSWITLEQGKTTADAMGDVWRGLEVVEAATRVGSDMLVRIEYIALYIVCTWYVHLHLHSSLLTTHMSLCLYPGGFIAKSIEWPGYCFVSCSVGSVCWYW